MPLPLAIAYAPGALDFFGGACRAHGSFTRPIDALLMIELLVITLGVCLKHGLFASACGIEYPLLVLVLMAAIAIRGCGRCAVDRLLGGAL